VPLHESSNYLASFFPFRSLHNSSNLGGPTASAALSNNRLFRLRLIFIVFFQRRCKNIYSAAPLSTCSCRCLKTSTQQIWTLAALYCGSNWSPQPAACSFMVAAISFHDRDPLERTFSSLIYMRNNRRSSSHFAHSSYRFTISDIVYEGKLLCNNGFSFKRLCLL
jgi:hypothetical protein